MTPVAFALHRDVFSDHHRDRTASALHRHRLVVADDAPLRATLARWLLAVGYAGELAEGRKRARTGWRWRIALALVAPQRLAEAGIDLAAELGSQVEHLVLIEEQSDQTGSYRWKRMVAIAAPMPAREWVRQSSTPASSITLLVDRAADRRARSSRRDSNS